MYGIKLNDKTMKRVTINKNEVGLVVKNKAVVRVLNEGKHWVGFGERADIYNMSNPFQVAQDLDVLLQLPTFTELVEVVEVGDNEIALQYVNNKGVLAAGRHIFWKGLNSLRFDIYDTSTLEIPKSINCELYERVPFSYYVRQFKVEPTEIGLLFVDGAFVKELKAGTYFFWKNTTTIQVSKVDLRLTSMDVVGQEILTKDKAQVRINFAIQYKVMDVMKALLENRNYDQ